jgi:threonine dehydrogenase-like Zn-dependent dehydrogenase
MHLTEEGAGLTMKAFVVTGPRTGAVEDVEPPVAGPGTVVVDVARVGVCGTDAEFFSGEMAYLHQTPARAAYPIRLGHEWCGTVAALGEGVDPVWLGRRVVGDTMLGCGACTRCRDGRQYLCAERYEIGIRGGWPGALAERLPVPAKALHPLPGNVDDVAGALVEPGANALRAVEAAHLGPGNRLLVWGSGTIGLLCALFALPLGAEVHVAGQDAATLNLARELGIHGAWTADALPDGPFDGVIDATNGAGVPAAALDQVEPGRRVVYIGLSGRPSLIDTRLLVLKEVAAVGVLSGSPGLAGAIEHYADGRVDPKPLVAATVGLAAVAGILAGDRPAGAGPGPKFHVVPSVSTARTGR